MLKPEDSKIVLALQRLVSSQQRDSRDLKSSRAVSFQDRLFAAAQDDIDFSLYVG
jgi:hypothetical protein